MIHPGTETKPKPRPRPNELSREAGKVNQLASASTVGTRTTCLVNTHSLVSRVGVSLRLG